jgi:hypothetical protein
MIADQLGLGCGEERPASFESFTPTEFRLLQPTAPIVRVNAGLNKAMET